MPLAELIMIGVAEQADRIKGIGLWRLCTMLARMHLDVEARLIEREMFVTVPNR